MVNDNQQTANPIRVMIVDDHDMVRLGLKILIESVPELACVGEASNGSEAVELYDNCQPDVVLMDILMPEMDGIQATRLIRSRDPQACIIALTSHTDENFVSAALEAGALSYLLKGISSDDLLLAIQNANVGKSTLAPQATQALIETFTQPGAARHNLTPVELQVLQGVARGQDNDEIAVALNLNTADVSEHIASILRKINVSSRPEAAAWAIHNDLIDTQ